MSGRNVHSGKLLPEGFTEGHPDPALPGTLGEMVGRAAVAHCLPPHKAMDSRETITCIACGKEVFSSGKSDTFAEQEVSLLSKDLSSVFFAGMRGDAVSSDYAFFKKSEGHGLVVGFPARNEERTVGNLVRRALALASFSLPVTVLVVDDGSSDETVALACAAGAIVVSVADNRTGLGAAVGAIFRNACALDAAAVAFMDADDEYAPEDLANLLAPILTGEADYVTGNRFHVRAPQKMPLWRNLGNRFGSVLVSLFSGNRVRDAQSGIRVLTREAAERVFLPHDYNYAQALTIGLIRQGFRMKEVPCSYRRREYGRSFIRLPEYLPKVGWAMLRARWGKLH